MVPTIARLAKAMGLAFKKDTKQCAIGTYMRCRM